MDPFSNYTLSKWQATEQIIPMEEWYTIAFAFIIHDSWQFYCKCSKMYFFCTTVYFLFLFLILYNRKIRDEDNTNITTNRSFKNTIYLIYTRFGYDIIISDWWESLTCPWPLFTSLTHTHWPSNVSFHKLTCNVQIHYI